MDWNSSSLKSFSVMIPLQILLPSNVIDGFKLNFYIMEIALVYLEIFLSLVYLEKLLPSSRTCFDKYFPTSVPPNTVYWGITSYCILYCLSADVFGVLAHNIKDWVIFFLTYPRFLASPSLWNCFLSNIFPCSLLESTLCLKL